MHHIYGTKVYSTQWWRTHVAFVAVPLALVIGVALFVAAEYAGTTLGRVAVWLAVIVTAIVPVAGVGVFEGAFNHLLKNVLYFGGASPKLMTRLFPPPGYEMPNNWFFEITGVLQFFASVPASYYSYLLWMNRN